MTQKKASTPALPSADSTFQQMRGHKSFSTKSTSSLPRVGRPIYDDEQPLESEKDSAVQAWTSDINTLQARLAKLARNSRQTVPNQVKEIQLALGKASTSERVLDLHGFSSTEEALVSMATQVHTLGSAGRISLPAPELIVCLRSLRSSN